MESLHKKLTAAGVLVTLGIIFGDIGTSPLYVMKAIIGNRLVDSTIILGGLSCVFWTLTLQTTFKYIFLTLEADNKGEGGIFSLYALVHRRARWLYIPVIIGAGTLLADGILTPPITVMSAIEGLHLINPSIPVIPIVLTIITLLFIFQRLGTKVVGSMFGPIMALWFSMLAILGMNQILTYPQVLHALNPKYAISLLINYPGGFWLLGAVFLATTGAEALYSDLGHCGRKNVRVAWIFVKSALVLNYLGQGAWLMQHAGTTLNGLNPFYEIMPGWFLWIGIGLATLATIIASQALITGSFTLISEAILLNFWPRVAIRFPSNIKGQLYIPSINWMMWAGCMWTVLYFETSTHMEAAYGFAITIAMLMTTTMMGYYLRAIKKFPLWLVVLIISIFATVELTFFIANVVKLKERLWFLVFGIGIIIVMYIWFKSKKILKQFISFVPIKENIPLLVSLSNDESVNKYAKHLVYLTKSGNSTMIEQRIINSIFSRNPKRADFYWLIHIDLADDPYTMEYSVQELVNDKIIRVTFKLGFRIQPRVNVLFRKVIEEMVSNNELDLKTRHSLEDKYHLPADFKFVVIERFLSIENELCFKDNFLLHAYFELKHFALPTTKAFGLDTSDVITEKVPLIISPISNVNLKRV